MDNDNGGNPNSSKICPISMASGLRVKCSGEACAWWTTNTGKDGEVYGQCAVLRLAVANAAIGGREENESG